jgi:hypothetical protein
LATVRKRSSWTPSAVRIGNTTSRQPNGVSGSRTRGDLRGQGETC